MLVLETFYKNKIVFFFMSNSILNFYDDCCFDKANIDAIWVL